MKQNINSHKKRMNLNATAFQISDKEEQKISQNTQQDQVQQQSVQQQSLSIQQQSQSIQQLEPQNVQQLESQNFQQQQFQNVQQLESQNSQQQQQLQQDFEKNKDQIQKKEPWQVFQNPHLNEFIKQQTFENKMSVGQCIQKFKIQENPVSIEYVRKLYDNFSYATKVNPQIQQKNNEQKNYMPGYLKSQYQQQKQQKFIEINDEEKQEDQQQINPGNIKDEKVISSFLDYQYSQRQANQAKGNFLQSQNLLPLYDYFKTAFTTGTNFKLNEQQQTISDLIQNFIDCKEQVNFECHLNMFKKHFSFELFKTTKNNNQVMFQIMNDQHKDIICDFIDEKTPQQNFKMPEDIVENFEQLQQNSQIKDEFLEKFKLQKSQKNPNPNAFFVLDLSSQQNSQQLNLCIDSIMETKVVQFNFLSSYKITKGNMFYHCRFLSAVYGEDNQGLGGYKNSSFQGQIDDIITKYQIKKNQKFFQDNLCHLFNLKQAIDFFAMLFDNKNSIQNVFEFLEAQYIQFQTAYLQMKVEEAYVRDRYCTKQIIEFFKLLLKIVFKKYLIIYFKLRQIYLDFFGNGVEKLIHFTIVQFLKNRSEFRQFIFDSIQDEIREKQIFNKINYTIDQYNQILENLTSQCKKLKEEFQNLELKKKEQKEFLEMNYMCIELQKDVDLILTNAYKQKHNLQNFPSNKLRKDYSSEIKKVFFHKLKYQGSSRKESNQIQQNPNEIVPDNNQIQEKPNDQQKLQIQDQNIKVQSDNVQNLQVQKLEVQNLNDQHFEEKKQYQENFNTKKKFQKSHKNSQWINEEQLQKEQLVIVEEIIQNVFQQIDSQKKTKQIKKVFQQIDSQKKIKQIKVQTSRFPLPFDQSDEEEKQPLHKEERKQEESFQQNISQNDQSEFITVNKGNKKGKQNKGKKLHKDDLQSPKQSQEIKQQSQTQNLTQFEAIQQSQNIDQQQKISLIYNEDDQQWDADQFEVSKFLTNKSFQMDRYYITQKQISIEFIQEIKQQKKLKNIIQQKFCLKIEIFYPILMVLYQCLWDHFDQKIQDSDNRKKICKFIPQLLIQFSEIEDIILFGSGFLNFNRNVLNNVYKDMKREDQEQLKLNILKKYTSSPGYYFQKILKGNNILILQQILISYKQLQKLAEGLQDSRFKIFRSIHHESKLIINLLQNLKNRESQIYQIEEVLQNLLKCQNVLQKGYMFTQYSTNSNDFIELIDSLIQQEMNKANELVLQQEDSTHKQKNQRLFKNYCQIKSTNKDKLDAQIIEVLKCKEKKQQIIDFFTIEINKFQAQKQIFDQMFSQVQKISQLEESIDRELFFYNETMVDTQVFYKEGRHQIIFKKTSYASLILKYEKSIEMFMEQIQDKQFHCKQGTHDLRIQKIQDIQLNKQNKRDEQRFQLNNKNAKQLQQQFVQKLQDVTVYHKKDEVQIQKEKNDVFTQMIIKLSEQFNKNEYNQLKQDFQSVFMNLDKKIQQIKESQFYELFIKINQEHGCLLLIEYHVFQVYKLLQKNIQSFDKQYNKFLINQKFSLPQMYNFLRNQGFPKIIFIQQQNQKLTQFLFDVDSGKLNQQTTIPTKVSCLDIYLHDQIGSIFNKKEKYTDYSIETNFKSQFNNSVFICYQGDRYIPISTGKYSLKDEMSFFVSEYMKSEPSLLNFYCYLKYKLLMSLIVACFGQYIEQETIIDVELSSKNNRKQFKQQMQDSKSQSINIMRFQNKIEKGANIFKQQIAQKDDDNIKFIDDDIGLNTNIFDLDGTQMHLLSLKNWYLDKFCQEFQNQEIEKIKQQKLVEKMTAEQLLEYDEKRKNDLEKEKKQRTKYLQKIQSIFIACQVDEQFLQIFKQEVNEDTYKIIKKMVRDNQMILGQISENEYNQTTSFYDQSQMMYNYYSVYCKELINTPFYNQELQKCIEEKMEILSKIDEQKKISIEREYGVYKYFEKTIGKLQSKSVFADVFKIEVIKISNMNNQEQLEKIKSQIQTIQEQQYQGSDQQKKDLKQQAQIEKQYQCILVLNNTVMKLYSQISTNNAKLNAIYSQAKYAFYKFKMNKMEEKKNIVKDLIKQIDSLRFLNSSENPKIFEEYNIEYQENTINEWTETQQKLNSNEGVSFQFNEQALQLISEVDELVPQKDTENVDKKKTIANKLQPAQQVQYDNDQQDFTSMDSESLLQKLF